MSRNPKPTPEELRFIYDLIIKGYDDTDIIEEYTHLYEQSQLPFPLRGDKRFFQDRRKELASAREVLQDNLKAVDPIATKRKDEHFNYLAEIVSSIAPEKTAVIETVGSEYAIRGANGKQTKLTKEQLTRSIKEFLKQAAKQYGHTDVCEYLIPHLEAEIAETTGKELNTFITENPLKFYKSLRLLADKRIFKGKCPFCREL